MNTQMWYLIKIRDPQALPGKNILKVLNLILKVMGFEYVFLDDIQGAEVVSLVEKENQFTPYTDIIKDIENVVQFDWGDFFLFKKIPQDWDIKNDYKDLIILTDTTVRAIDDTYIYIYTPNEELLKVLKQTYEVYNVSLDFIQNLEFPY